MSKIERVLAEAELAALVHQLVTQTANIADRWATQIVNRVLLTELVIFDAQGLVTRPFHTSMGSVAVSNHGTGTITVQGGSPSGDSLAPPGRGRGLGRVHGGRSATLNLTGTVLSLYGTPGEFATIQVFTKPQPPAWGPGTSNTNVATQLVTATGNGTLDIRPWLAAGYTTLRMQLLAGGLGGGSGRQGAAATVRCGGGPGATGAFSDTMVPLADVLALFPTGLVPYNVGPGTAGGAAVATPDTNGNPGAAATTLVNGTWLGANPASASCIAVARPGIVAAQGGTALTGTAGTAQIGSWPTPTGVSASTTGGVAGANNGAAGAGGGITAADAPSAGAAGGSPLVAGGTGGTGGVVGGAAPGSGTLGLLDGHGVPPGGGAASITGPAQAGANALANSGAGGGGGGASLNGNDSGPGGAGGSGWARFTAFR